MGQGRLPATEGESSADYAAGASAIFPPGTVIADSALKMLEILTGGDDGAKTAAE